VYRGVLSCSVDTTRQPVKVTSDTELSLLKSKIAEIKMQLKQEKAGSLQVDGGVSLGTYVT